MKRKSGMHINDCCCCCMYAVVALFSHENLYSFGPYVDGYWTAIVRLNCCDSPFGDGLETSFPLLFLFRGLRSHYTAHAHILSVFLLCMFYYSTRTLTHVYTRDLILCFSFSVMSHNQSTFIVLYFTFDIISFRTCISCCQAAFFFSFLYNSFAIILFNVACLYCCAIRSLLTVRFKATKYTHTFAREYYYM